MTSEFRIDLDEASGDILAKFLDKKTFNKYYISFEKGEETGKPHWQGWVTYGVEENTYRKTCAAFARSKGLDGKKNQFAFGKVKDIDTCQAYIIKNETKEYYDHRTNYSSEELEDLKSKLTTYVSKEKFRKIRKQCTESFWDKCYKKLEEECLREDLKGDKQIQYKAIPEVFRKQCSKNLDRFIVERMIVGLTNKLEVNYPCKSNNKIKNLYYSWFENNDKMSEIFI